MVSYRHNKMCSRAAGAVGSKMPDTGVTLVWSAENSYRMKRNRTTKKSRLNWKRYTAVQVALCVLHAFSDGGTNTYESHTHGGSVFDCDHAHVVVVENETCEESICRLQGRGDPRGILRDVPVREHHQLKLGASLSQFISLRQCDKKTTKHMYKR